MTFAPDIAPDIRWFSADESMPDPYVESWDWDDEFQSLRAKIEAYHHTEMTHGGPPTLSSIARAANKFVTGLPSLPEGFGWAGRTNGPEYSLGQDAWLFTQQVYKYKLENQAA